MWTITFSMLNGFQKEKKFKTFAAAKTHYSKYTDNMGFWFNITLMKDN